MNLLARLLTPPPVPVPLRASRGPEPWLTVANVVTVIRLVVGTAIFVEASRRGSATLNLVGLAVFWSLDIADGALARALHQETRLGAQLDILADRLLVAFFYFNHAHWHPEVVVPMALFMIQFAFLDQYLSNQFLRWHLRSPNYFFTVDRRIWTLNWSPLAKALNGGLMTVMLLTTRSAVLASSVAIALMAVKGYSIARVLRLRAPEEREASFDRGAVPVAMAS